MDRPPFIEVEMERTARTTRCHGYTVIQPPGTVIKRTAVRPVWIDESVFALQGVEPPERITVKINVSG